MIKKIKLISLSTPRFHSDVTHIEFSKMPLKRIRNLHTRKVYIQIDNFGVSELMCIFNLNFPFFIEE